LTVTVEGRSHHCLVDTGSETSLIPWKLVSNQKLLPASQCVFAADGGELGILGKSYVHFMIGELPMSAMFLVSDDIEEMTLGIDWLADHQCKWDIGAGVLYLGDYCLKLSSQASCIMCRCVYTTEDVLVPPHHGTDLKTKLTWTRWFTPKTNWLVDARELRPGVQLAL